MPGESRSWISDGLIEEDPVQARDQLAELNRQLDEIWGHIEIHQLSISATSAGLGGRGETPTHLGGGIYKMKNVPLTGTLQVFIKYPTSDGTGAWVMLNEPDEYSLSGKQFALVNGALPTGSKVKVWYVY